MKTFALVMIVFALVASGCAANGSISASIRTEIESLPLPSDLTIVPPEPGTSPQIAAFSGKWEGIWRGQGTALHQAHILAVERIGKDEATVVIAWGAVPEWGTVPGWARLQAKVRKDNSLEVKTPKGATVIYSSPGKDGAVDADLYLNWWRNHNHHSWATLRKAPQQ